MDTKQQQQQKDKNKKVLKKWEGETRHADPARLKRLSSLSLLELSHRTVMINIIIKLLLLTVQSIIKL